MNQSKGVTPVIATVLLLVITVAAGATLYKTVLDTSKSAQQTPDLREADFEVESCWGSNIETNIAIRNTGDRAVNLSGVDVMTNFTEVDYRFKQKIAEPGETFTLAIKDNLKWRETVTLTSKDVQLDYRCYEIKESQPEQPSQPTYILEEGGQTLNSLLLGSTTGSLTLTGYNDKLCLGSGCDYETKSATSFDSNDRVDRKGDSVSGALKTSKVTWSGELCIGENCPTNTGSQTGFLTKSKGEMNGPLTVRNITSDSNLCLGTNC